MDPFRQVNAGEPLRIPAPTWNRLMEVGRHFGRHRAEVQPPPPGDDPLPPAVRVLVRNDTGGALAERAVVALTTPPLDPTVAPFDAQRTPLFGGIAPAAATDVVAVLEGPLAAAAIGRAVVMGVAVVQLDVADVGHTHCGPTAGVTGYLTTAAIGPIRVLWKESGTGSKLGMVLMQEVGDGTLTTGNVGDSGAQDSTTTVLRFNEATGSKITKGATAGDPDVHTLLAASASQMGAVTVGAQTVGGRKKSATAAGSRAAWVAESSQAEGAPDSPTSRWTPFVASYTGTTPAYTGGMTIDVFAASASDFPDSQLAVGQIVTQFRAEHGDLIGTTEDRTIAGLYATLAPGGSGPVRYFAVGDPMNEAGVNEFPHAFGCFRLGYLKQGIDASTTGLTVPGTVVGGIVTATRTLSIAAGDVSGLAAVATSGDYADITGGPPATTTVAASYDSGTKDLTITVNGVSTTVNLT